MSETAAPLRYPIRYRLEAALAWLVFAVLKLVSVDPA